MKPLIRLAGASAIGLCIAATNALATQPIKGASLYSGTVTSVQGSNCGIVVDAVDIGYFYYPGPSKIGAYIRSVFFGGSNLSLSTFPVTPAAGVRQWNGTYVARSPITGQATPQNFAIQFYFGGLDGFEAAVSVTEQNGCVVDGTYAFWLPPT
jgi:hypothetical protein